ncbi:MAG: elongation factor [Candidatus Binatota bacterium]|jgi:elongation factor G|nr:elongation factor [Candidatus Binatota bacterium]
MPVEDGSKIRNVAIFGQGGVGKTSLADGLLFASGAAARLGHTSDGSSAFDFEPEEIHHQVSLSTALATVPWRKHEITLLDTPGYANFLAETRDALRVVDGGVLLLPPGAQIKVETERVWRWAGEEGIGCLGFVSNLDREEADLDGLLERLRQVLGVNPVLLTLPIGGARSAEEGGLRGFVDLLHSQAVVFSGATGQFKTEPISADLAQEAKAARERLIETVAESSDELIEKYLETGELGEDDLREGLRAGTLARKFLPVLCGSSARMIGVHALLDAIVDCLGSPVDAGPRRGFDPKTGEDAERPPDPAAPFSALVFKTLIDPFAGKLSIFRIFSGTIRADSTVANASRDTKERIGQVLRLDGKKHHPMSEAVAGEIAATAKLKDTLSGDTLADEKQPIVYPPLPEAPPSISFAIEPKTKGDEEKANQALVRLLEEDLGLRTHRDPQTHEIILSGAGQLHVEIVVERLKRKFGVEVDLKAPKIPYRETIKGKANAQGKYKKQSGGRGQYGDTWIEIEPLSRGKGFEFVDKIVGGVIPRQYIPAVEKGVRDTMQEGFLAGYPMQDVRVTLYDGSFHAVDSSEMAFKIAGSMGFKAALDKAKPILLEPVMKLTVTTPAESMGDVIGDLNSRRGKVSGVEPKEGEEVIQALVPMAQVLRYAPDLRSMTSGRGTFTVEFSHYEEVPAHLTEKIVDAAKAAKAHKEGAKA